MTYTAPRPAFAFLLSEGNGEISRDELTLKTNAAVYAVGTLVMSEIATGAATGKFVRVTQTLVDADTGHIAEYAIVSEETDATAADTLAPVISWLATVKSRELVLDASITTSEAAALLKKQFVRVR
jgi:hypothetical protein